MKVTAPISRIDEIEPLAAAGADELYCGVVPKEWIARFNTGAVNRRYFGNLGGLEELRDAVAIAQRSGAKLFMVLNAQSYGGTHQDALVELAGRFRDFGGDAVIVADIALIAELRERQPDLAIHVSSVAGCRNSAGIGFYRDLGVRRVILPRDVTLDEIGAMARAADGVEIEAFVLNDGCVFEEGVCHSIHLPANQGGPICIDSRTFDYRDAKGGRISERTARKLRENDKDYKRWLWYRFGCGFSTTPEGYPFGPCGLCAISRLEAAGVTSIKIAGREGATERKLKSAEMVRAVVDRVHGGSPHQEAAKFAVGIRKAEEHCRTGFMCYYPEVRWQHGSQTE
ncbi:MAG TPA: U32 family peptidase [Rhodocyclaceae bacterium]|nr:U32 family peptidase [Rhodocyclaceae bacterium]